VVTGSGAIAQALGCRASSGGARTLRVWGHQGQEAENRAVRAIASAFNRAHEGLRVELTFFPDFHYAEKLSIAAAAEDMPDAFELDGPFVSRFVDAGLLAPLGDFFSSDELADFLPTIILQGTIAGRLYALGAFDSAAVLYYDRRRFDRARVTPPAPERAYDFDELTLACEKLASSGVEPLALHLNESADEWFTYAFSPVVWSGGGRLILEDGLRVSGVLASPENVASLEAWQGLFRRGFAATDPVDPDPFGNARVGMDWSGHWMARSHLAKKGADLGVMPLPRIGAHSVAPCGSYCWGISARSEVPELAARWVRWITDATHGIQPLVRANGAVPARRSAFEAFPEYAEVPYALFRQQLEERARPRPRTPFYATLTQRFAAALRDIARGSDVAQRLARAEDEVQRVIDRRIGRSSGGGHPETGHEPRTRGG
jgi:ABC-type glycerol-3-phosphate transport system substrate-binding protein